jgi:hypothetical protein
MRKKSKILKKLLGTQETVSLVIRRTNILCLQFCRITTLYSTCNKLSPDLLLGSCRIQSDNCEFYVFNEENSFEVLTELSFAKWRNAFLVPIDDETVTIKRIFENLVDEISFRIEKVFRFTKIKSKLKLECIVDLKEPVIISDGHLEIVFVKEGEIGIFQECRINQKVEIDGQFYFIPVREKFCENLSFAEYLIPDDNKYLEVETRSASVGSVGEPILLELFISSKEVKPLRGKISLNLVHKEAYLIDGWFANINTILPGVMRIKLYVYFLTSGFRNLPTFKIEINEIPLLRETGTKTVFVHPARKEILTRT